MSQYFGDGPNFKPGGCVRAHLSSLLERAVHTFTSISILQFAPPPKPLEADKPLVSHDTFSAPLCGVSFDDGIMFERRGRMTAMRLSQTPTPFPSTR
jgi:hypothetical protein